MQFILVIFSPLAGANPFQIFLTSLSTQLYVLSLKKTEQNSQTKNQSKQANQPNNKAPNETGNTRKCTKPMTFILCWPTTPWGGACPGVCLTYSVSLCWRTPGIVCFWVGVRLYVHFPFLVLGYCLVRMIACLVYAVTASGSSQVYQLCYVQKMQFPWSHSPSLALKISPSPQQGSLSLEGKTIGKSYI